METDALARRLRFAPPSPREAFVLSDVDYLMFEAIDRHGPLPTPYLFEFQKHRRRNYANLQRRLTMLFNGHEQGVYLTRPTQQHAGYMARYQPLVYDLSPRGTRALAEHGTLALYPPTGSAWFLHQLMQACVGASLELTAPSKGLRYVGRDEVLRLPQCAPARQAQTPLAIPVPGLDRRKLIPDDIFALENADGRKRFFLVEIDRATESMKPYEDERRSSVEKTTYFAGKLTGYVAAMRAGTLKERFGMLRPQVLIVTTNPTRVRQTINHIRSLDAPDLQARFAVACVPAFGGNWRVPTAVLNHLLDEPWLTVFGPKDITQP